ncbi:hypothetical protein BDY19DRAFT_910905 [Irpex rosettiformis]|uniref:Uncharacterized protein n=1 Tax=Irpex rosettiformis TaxID=378272 RepID=A0ACB8TM40_9APHY|nr:hypothetical protein BDY19DRAFT_910905 [Irpex rosettiformis]
MEILTQSPGRGRSFSLQPLDNAPSPPRTASAPPALHSPRSLLFGDAPSSPEVSTPAMWDVLNDAAEALGSHFPPQQLTEAIANLATLCGLDSAPCPSPVDNGRPKASTASSTADPTVKTEVDETNGVVNGDDGQAPPDHLRPRPRNSTHRAYGRTT